MTRTEYISRAAAPAQEACKGTGLFASLMLAQGIIESGNGNSLLAAPYNNHFGIKADKSWKGKVVSLKTREVYSGKSVMITDGFRVYDTLTEGFRDRCAFLKNNPRYAKAGVFTAKTPEEQAEAFQRAGYATDPQYSRLLIAVMKGSNLKRFDIH